LLCQKPDEEIMVSFFSGRLPVEVKTSRCDKFLVVIDEFNSAAEVVKEF